MQPREILTTPQDQDAATGPGQALPQLERCQSRRWRTLRWCARRAAKSLCRRGFGWTVCWHRRLSARCSIDQLRLLLLVYCCTKSLHGEPHAPSITEYPSRTLSGSACGSARPALHNSSRRRNDEATDHEQGRAQGNDRYGYGRGQWRRWLDWPLERSQG